MTAVTTVWRLVRKTVDEFQADGAMRLAAALAYYTALSLAPLLLVVIAIAGAVFGRDAASGALDEQIAGTIGPQAAETVQSLLAASQPKNGGLVAGIVGLATLVIGATGVFASLQDVLNVIWDVDPNRTSAGGLWAMVKDRLLSFSMVCGMAFLLLVSLLMAALLHGLTGVLTRWWPGAAVALQWGNFALSLLVTFGMFAMIFKVLPHARPRWSDVWIGAAVTTGLFAVGKFLIGLYLGRAAVGSTFGAAGSFVVLLTWLYYSSLILLLGAEFTQVYANYKRPGQTAEEPAAVGRSDGAHQKSEPVPVG